jgi:hypothetical protein
MIPEATCEYLFVLADDIPPLTLASPVYEYPLNGQWIMMDMDDGYVLWTGIWKALGNHKGIVLLLIFSLHYFF